MKHTQNGLETKDLLAAPPVMPKNQTNIEGYASRFDIADKSGDIVKKGAFCKSLMRLKDKGQSVKMLWQHDVTRPIGVWHQVYEDEIGLYVKGEIIANTRDGEDALTLFREGAIDGLSIGYKTLKAKKAPNGERHLIELDLWEVSLVTFPMLPEAHLKRENSIVQQTKSENIKPSAAKKRLLNELRDLSTNLKNVQF